VKWGWGVSTVPNEVDDIRRQMAEIRRVLHEDVQGVVATAEAATDWRRYLTAYPWVSLGAAFAVGYFIVPRGHPTVATAAELSKVQAVVRDTRDQVVEAAKGESQGKSRRKKGLIAAGLGMVAPLVVKAAQSYALSYLEQWMLQQQQGAAHAGPPREPEGRPRPSPGPGRGAGPRRGPGFGSA